MAFVIVSTGLYIDRELWVTGMLFQLGKPYQEYFLR